MNTFYRRCGLSFIVGLGCWFGAVQAQTPPGTAPANTPAPAPTTSAITIEVSAPIAGESMVLADPPARGRFLSWPIFQRPSVVDRTAEVLQRHGHCCDHPRDGFGCANWHAQASFVFGSCRTFFGESCPPKTPHPLAYTLGIRRQ